MSQTDARATQQTAGFHDPIFRDQDEDETRATVQFELLTDSHKIDRRYVRRLCTMH